MNGSRGYEDKSIELERFAAAKSAPHDIFDFKMVLQDP